MTSRWIAALMVLSRSRVSRLKRHCSSARTREIERASADRPVPAEYQSASESLLEVLGTSSTTMSRLDRTSKSSVASCRARSSPFCVPSSHSTSRQRTASSISSGRSAAARTIEETKPRNALRGVERSTRGTPPSVSTPASSLASLPASACSCAFAPNGEPSERLRASMVIRRRIYSLSSKRAKSAKGVLFMARRLEADEDIELGRDVAERRSRDQEPQTFEEEISVAGADPEVGALP